MTKFINIFSSIILALVSLAPLSVDAQFQSQTYCYDDSINKTYMGDPNVVGSCANDGTPGNRIPIIINEPFYAICYNVAAEKAYVIPNDSTTGSFDCPSDIPLMKTCPAFGGPPAMCLQKPGTQTNTNTSTGNSNTGRTNTGGSSSSGSTPSTPCNPPEEGFHLVGGLCVPKSPLDKGNNLLSATTAGELAAKIIRILLYFAGIVAVIFVIIGGYLYMTARGNDAQALNGRKTLVNALIGLAIIILSYVIVQAVLNFLTSPT